MEQKVSFFFLRFWCRQWGCATGTYTDDVTGGPAAGRRGIFALSTTPSPPSSASQISVPPSLPTLHTSSSRAFPLFLALNGTCGSGTLKSGGLLRSSSLSRSSSLEINLAFAFLRAWLAAGHIDRGTFQSPLWSD